MFVIPSVIAPCAAPLDYTSVRSVFTPEQRLEQTIGSIESIRNYTDEKILLIECSNHTNIGLDISILNQLVDTFVDLSLDSNILSVCNSPNKSWAEIQMLHRALSFIPVNERIYKLSGRYFLLETFDKNKFDRGDISAKIFHDGLPPRCCGVVYSMKDRDTYGDFTSYCISKYNMSRHVSMEDMLYAWACNKNFNVLSSIDAGGSIAVSGNKETY